MTAGSSFDVAAVQRRTLAPLQWCVALIGLSVPISVALDNVLLALLLLGALFSLGSIARIVMSHPVARAATLIFAALLVAMCYGTASLGEAFATLGKYVDLLFIPVFIFLLANETARRRARHMFLAAMAVTLLLSFLVGLQILPVMAWMSALHDPGSAVIFHSRITQNNMMAFAAFLALLEWRAAATIMRKLGWGMFALLATINVLFMVQGKTGYLILLVLLAWFVWCSMAEHMRKQGKHWGWRQAGLIALTFMAVSLLAYQASPRLHDRVADFVAEYQAWTPDHGKLTSTGQRLDFYSNTAQIVAAHPLFGVGTGGFPAAFEQQIQGKDVINTNNPHNEYLMITVQTGVLGLGLLLFLFYTQWRHAPLLPSAFEQDAARGLVLAYMLNGALNSALMDHADGLFFAFMTAVLFAGLNRESNPG